MTLTTVESIVVNLPMPMLQHREEIIPFGAWVLDHDVNSILEIGTGPGGTTMLWGQLVSSVISIDLPSDDAVKTHNQLGMALRNFRSALGDSQKKETFDYIQQLLGGQLVDLLFVDGDHRYEAVAQDFETYRKLVRKGGWVAFHDINASSTWPDMGVPRFWRELKGVKEEFLVGPYSENPPSWGGIGVVQR